MSTRCSSGKKHYPNEKLAEQFARILEVQHRRRHRTYKCDECGAWHCHTNKRRKKRKETAT